MAFKQYGQLRLCSSAQCPATLQQRACAWTPTRGPQQACQHRSRSWPLQAQHEERVSNQQLSCRTDRRALLLGSIAAPLLADSIAGSPAQARKQAGVYKDATTLDEATSATEFVESSGPAFSLKVPAKWQAVEGLDTSGSVLGSWFNSFVPGAETLAVYKREVDARSTRDLGTAEEVAKGLAGVAPNSLTLGSNEYTDSSGRVYYVAIVEFDGNTAGRFGAAVECRTVCVVDGVQYTLRITTTRFRWLAFPEVRQELEEVVESFRIKA